MKIDWNQKYTTVAVYAFLVIAASILFVLLLLSMGSIFSFFGTLLSLATPFIIGFSIAYLLNPVMMFFEKRLFEAILKKKPLSARANRALSLFLAVILVLAFIALFLLILVPHIGDSVMNLAQNINHYANSAVELVEKWSTEFGFQLGEGSLADSFEDVLSGMSDFLAKQLPNLLDYTKNVTSGILNILVGFIVSVYLLASKERFFAQIKKLLYAVFPKRFVEASVSAVHTANNTFSGFLYGKLLDSLIIGIMNYIGMLILQLPYPELISVVVGVTNVIPYFGPFMGAIPGILLIFMVDPMKSLWFAIFILALQQFDGNILGPRILGETTGLSAFWVIFSITIGGGLFGVLGMFLGVPAFSLIYGLIRMLVEGQLEKKGMPTSTYAYSSPRHPLPSRNAAPKTEKKSASDEAEQK